MHTTHIRHALQMTDYPSNTQLTSLAFSPIFASLASSSIFTTPVLIPMNKSSTWILKQPSRRQPRRRTQQRFRQACFQHLWLYDAQSMQLLTANTLRIGTKYKTLRSSCQAGGGEWWARTLKWLEFNAARDGRCPSWRRAVSLAHRRCRF